MSRLAVWFATFFGVGRLPLAPGTWASAVALVLFWLLLPAPLIYGGILLALTLLGVPACTEAERVAGEQDPGSVVLDEVAGMGVAMLWLPGDPVEHRPYLALMAFILFRLFDIWKPWPVHRFQNLRGGWGIMADDLAAGVYANALVQLGAFVVRQIA